jgi:biotin carboxyl carrier protein
VRVLVVDDEKVVARTRWRTAAASRATLVTSPLRGTATRLLSVHVLVQVRAADGQIVTAGSQVRLRRVR